MANGKSKNRNNGTKIFNISTALAGGTKGRYIMYRSILLATLLFAAMATIGACDDAKDKSNPASMKVDHGELSEAVNSGDLENTAVDGWVDSPHLGINLKPEGETIPAYSGNCTIDTTAMSLFLEFADIKPGKYDIDKFGLPSCANLVDDANELVTKITIYPLDELDSEVDGGTGFVSNNKVYRIVPDQACIDTPGENKTTVIVNAVAPTSSASISDCTVSVQGADGNDQSIEEDSTEVVSIEFEDCENYTFCDDNSVVFEIEPGKYTISVECPGDQKASDMVTVPDISTPHEVKLIVHTELDEGKLCSKRTTFSFGLNLKVRDLAKSIGRVKNGVCDLSDISDEARMAAVMSFDANCGGNVTTGDFYGEDEDPDAGTDGGTYEGPDFDLSDYDFLNMVLLYIGSVEVETDCTGSLAIDGNDIGIDMPLKPYNIS